MSSSGGSIQGSTVVAPANPAAGADWSFTLTQAGLLVALGAILTCSAAVANRVPTFQYQDGAGHTLWRSSGNFTDVANNVTPLVFSIGGVANGSAGILNYPLPAGLVLPVGATVSSFTQGIQAADQWSAIVLTFSDR